MATTETDLMKGDPALLDLIGEFAEGLSPAGDRASRRMLPFSLSGFSEFTLSARCDLESSGDLLVWVVRAVQEKDADRARPVELRYGVDTSSLGDVRKDRARCEWRLRKLAEAHLRAHLHVMRFGLEAPATGGVTLLDEKGRLRDP